MDREDYSTRYKTLRRSLSDLGYYYSHRAGVTPKKLLGKNKYIRTAIGIGLCLIGGSIHTIVPVVGILLIGSGLRHEINRTLLSLQRQFNNGSVTLISNEIEVLKPKLYPHANEAHDHLFKNSEEMDTLLSAEIEKKKEPLFGNYWSVSGRNLDETLTVDESKDAKYWIEMRIYHYSELSDFLAFPPEHDSDNADDYYLVRNLFYYETELEEFEVVGAHITQINSALFPKIHASLEKHLNETPAEEAA